MEKSYSQCINTFPYFEGFETAPSWTASGANSDWAWGTPAHPTINTAGGGTKSWCIGGLSGSFYNYYEMSFLTSPCFDFSNLNYPWISFKIFWEDEWKYDGMVLQASTDGGNTWTNIGAYGDTVDCNTNNWYNYNNVSWLTNIGNNPKHGWCGRLGASYPSGSTTCQGGNGSGGWVIATHCLNGLANQPNVLLRFAFGAGFTCNNFDGIAIDDITISDGLPFTPTFSYTCSGNHQYNFQSNVPSCPAVRSYSWNFGDPASGSNTSNVANPTHVFSGPGTYTVSLTVSGNACNPPGTYTQMVNVFDIQSVTETNPIKCYGGMATVSVNISGNGAVTYSWVPAGVNTASAQVHAGNYTVMASDNGCVSMATISVSQPPAMSVSVNYTNITCGGSSNSGAASVSVTGGSPPYSYTWMPSGGNTSSVNNLSAGNYTVFIQDNNQCNTSESIIISQMPAYSLLCSPDVSICVGQTAVLSASVNGGTPPYRYIWVPTNGLMGNSCSVSPSITTTYSVYAIDGNGCSSNTDTIRVYVYPLLSAAGMLDTVCRNETAIMGFSLTSGGNGGPYQYLWNTGAVTKTISVLANNTSVVNYTVIVSDGCNVPATAVSTLVINPLPRADFSGVNLKGCAPLTVTFNAVTSKDNVLYHWDFGNGQFFSGNPASATYTNAGTYSVSLEVTDKYGCKSDTVMLNYVEVYSYPVAGFVALPWVTSIDQPEISFSNTSVGAVSYWWNFGDYLSANNVSTLTNPAHLYSQAGSYSVTLVATSIHGCSSMITEVVDIKGVFAIYIPNTFTPNGDGLNDIFSPKGVGIDLNNYKLMIFDRWGEKIYETKNFYKGWDGTVKGKVNAATQDVYIYKIWLKDVNGTEHEYVGHITCLPDNGDF